MPGAPAALLDDLVHVSRALGADPSLVLHGGGNTSIKATRTDITGEVIDALYVKGSGWDLATIERAGFAALSLTRLHALLGLTTLTDSDMMRELSVARLDPSAPQPSVEALLHAFIPHPVVLHSHADRIVALSNTPDGESLIREVYGTSVVVVPYVMPGFDLAREVARRWADDAHAGTIGMVLLKHGLFTFGADASTAYDHHIRLVGAAAAHIDGCPHDSSGPSSPPTSSLRVQIADLRRRLSRAAGRPLIVTRDASGSTMSFVARADLNDVASLGPITPDHVIRTKAVPLIGRDVDEYAAAYVRYFETHAPQARTPVTMLDPAPRIVLDPELGMLAAGPRTADAQIAADIYRHTMQVISWCEDRLGGWRPLGAQDLFDMEYWELEQAKLHRGGLPPALAGTVAIVTGAASGIGRESAAALLERGAAVIGIDHHAGVVDRFDDDAWCGVQADVTDPDAQRAALDVGVDRFGGIDIAVLAAGVFGASTPVGALDRDEWRRVLSINLDAIADAFQSLHALLARSPVGGRVVLIGSKNVRAPGIGAAAYSASKAAVTQLARVAAMEWAADGIRVNTVHPDAVFDTGLWTDELLAQRAAAHDMSVDQYKRRNLLGVEITARLVGRTVAELCGDSFAATTGAQIPVDGGNERTI
jgi:rhamnose utilization protein RhaD (predicted bifunctional aldolase and dehydrogenase)/NAD(P)-dependent dehydrogenase (short-subunit alcohol dehydrogenase family)